MASREYAIGGPLGAVLVSDQGERSFVTPGGGYLNESSTAPITTVFLEGVSATAQFGLVYEPESGVWDAVEGTNRTLSNGDKTTTATGESETISATGHTTGKYYVEFRNLYSSTVFNMSVGFADDPVGGDFLPYLVLNNGGGLEGGAYIDNPLWAWGTGDVISMAVDHDANRAWFRKNGDAWIPDGDPAAGTGGVDFTGVFHDNRLVVWAEEVGSTATLLSGPGHIFPLPAGFSTWDVGTGVFDVVVDVTGLQVLAAVGEIRAPLLGGQWDTAFGAPGTYSNGNKKFTGTGVDTQSLSMHTTGKYYAEFWKATAANSVSVGLADLSDYSPYQMWVEEGYMDGSHNVDIVPAFTANDVIGLAIDFDAKKLFFRKNGDAWLFAGNPVAGTGGIVLSSTTWEEPRLVAWLGGSGTVSLLSGPDFVYDPPAGYGPWDTGVSGAITVNVLGVQADAFIGDVTVKTGVTATLDGLQVLASVGVIASGSAGILDAWDWSRTTNPLIVLSNGDRTATAPSGQQGNVYSSKEWATGKHYAEITVTAAPFPQSSVGAVHHVNGSTDDGVYFYASGDVYPVVGGSFTGQCGPGAMPALANGDVIGIAYNADLGKVWIRVNGGAWNNDPLQVPL